jgi:hypothetical protein
MLVDCPDEMTDTRGTRLVGLPKLLLTVRTTPENWNST